MTFGQLLLLVSVVGLADAWNCGSEFGDVASRTVRAVAVFEGRAKRRINAFSPRSGNNSDPVAQVVFRVGKILKGDIEGLVQPRANNSGSSKGLLVAVGFFGSREDPSICTGSLESVRVGASYIVFVGNRTSSKGQQAESKGQWSGSNKRQIPSFTISGRPEPTSSEVIRIVQSYNCSKCAREPKSRLSVTKTSLDIGEKLQLHCHTMGQPNSVVTWFKDGTPLVHSRHQQIRHSRRSSRLRIKEMSGMDFGVYQCIARNVLGISNVSSCTVSLRTHETPTEKPHAVLCADHSYCLNGGICFILTPLNITFCQCKIGFEGGRCEEKHTGISAVRAFAETPKASKDVELCALISLATGAILASIVPWLCIVAYAVKRLCRKQLQHHKNPARSSCPSLVSRGWIANSTLKLLQPDEDFPQYNLLPSGDVKQTEAAAQPPADTSAISDPCGSDRQHANANIPKRLSSSASSLLQFLVPRSLSRPRLQAVSGSFDCEDPL